MKKQKNTRRSRKLQPDPADLLALRPGLERDTALMPWAVAETVCGEVARFLDVELPARYAVWIEARAELCYARQDHFRKLMRSRGNAPRECLRVFMRHWLAALLGVERPDLYECLPRDFALGHALPPPRLPRRRWNGNGRPLYGPMDWNPERVLRHRHWHWLAKRLPARTPEDRRANRHAVTATDRQIDTMVYALHRLTPDQIALVEGVQ